MGAQPHWLDLNDGDEEDFDEDDGDDEFEDVGWAPCQLVPVKCEADWIGEEDTKGLEGCRKRWKFSWKVEFSSVEEVILRWYICKRENLASREKRSLQCKWPMRELQYRPPFLNIGIGKIIALKRANASPRDQLTAKIQILWHPGRISHRQNWRKNS